MSSQTPTTEGPPALTITLYANKPLHIKSVPDGEFYCPTCTKDDPDYLLKNPVFCSHTNLGGNGVVNCAVQYLKITSPRHADGAESKDDTVFTILSANSPPLIVNNKHNVSEAGAEFPKFKTVVEISTRQYGQTEQKHKADKGVVAEDWNTLIKDQAKQVDRDLAALRLDGGSSFGGSETHSL